MLDILRLRCLAILWCEGNDSERMQELYDIVQEDGHKEIAYTDKDMKAVFFILLELSTEMAIR